jgi:hypothetical protein
MPLVPDFLLDFDFAVLSPSFLFVTNHHHGRPLGIPHVLRLEPVAPLLPRVPCRLLGPACASGGCRSEAQGERPITVVNVKS